MKKAIIALSLLAVFASCEKKEYTCRCIDGDRNTVFRQTLSELDYSEFQTYCANAEVENHHLANSVTCTVENGSAEEETTEKK